MAEAAGTTDDAGEDPEAKALVAFAALSAALLDLADLRGADYARTVAGGARDAFHDIEIGLDLIEKRRARNG